MHVHARTHTHTHTHTHTPTQVHDFCNVDMWTLAYEYLIGYSCSDHHREDMQPQARAYVKKSMKSICIAVVRLTGIG